MADPVTLGVIGVGATAAGGGIKALGNIFTGNAQAAADNYRSQIAQMNAQIAQQDAQYAVASGEVEAQQSGYRTADEVGRTKAGFAASNIDVKSGSAAQVVSSEIAIGKQNQSIIRANSAKRAFGFEVTAANDVAQSNLYKLSASYDRTSGYINAASTVLGTVGSVSSSIIGGGKQGSGVFSG